uniref:Calmodulin-binding domain-containing protein n=1 Tax=Zea mays TaxID=4577 RepID=A0A804P4I1_MAIZE
MKVNTKIKLEPVMAPSSSLPRSASELPDPPSPFSSNTAHHPVSVPTTPRLSLSCSSFGHMVTPPTDTPPITPTKKQDDKPKPTPEAATAANYASLWSPKRLMQRAARAFRRSRSRARVRTVKDLAEERASVLAASSKVSDEAAAAATAVPPAGAKTSSSNDARDGAMGSVQDEPRQQRHDDYHHPEIVPEKIIHEDALPVVAAEKETAAAAATSKEEEEVESPKKGAALSPVPEAIVIATAATSKEEEEEEVESPKKEAALSPAPAPEAIVAVAAVEDVVADKFVTVVKEAIKKQEAEEDEKEEAMRRFQGSRVRTALEARAESEQPRRREVARSNDVIEEARTKLLEKRRSKVKALVGAFETVIDTKKDSDDAAAGKPEHHNRNKSA